MFYFPIYLTKNILSSFEHIGPMVVYLLLKKKQSYSCFWSCRRFKRWYSSSNQYHSIKNIGRLRYNKDNTLMKMHYVRSIITWRAHRISSHSQLRQLRRAYHCTGYLNGVIGRYPLIHSMYSDSLCLLEFAVRNSFSTVGKDLLASC